MGIACEDNYRDDFENSGTGIRQRAKRILERAKASGLPRDKMISLVALAYRESNNVWLMPYNPIFGDDPLDQCCRTIVAIEYGAKTDHGLRYRKSVSLSPEDIDFLSARGMITGGPDGHYLSGPATKLGSDGIADWFTFVVARRRADLLENFSLGPTQMWLGCGPVSEGPHPCAGKPLCGWPKTWEEIWAFFTSSSVSALAEKITYLDPLCSAPQYPASTGGDPHAKSVAWLNKHTGGGGGEKYWEGVGSADPETYAYKNTLPRVSKIAQDIGY